MPLQLEIVTPEARVFSDEVDSVVLPGAEGELGVLPQHAPLVTTLKPGELRYTKASKVLEYCVGEGLVEITGSAVRVLTDIALDEAGIDETARPGGARPRRGAHEGKGHRPRRGRGRPGPHRQVHRPAPLQAQTPQHLIRGPALHFDQKVSGMSGRSLLRCMPTA